MLPEITYYKSFYWGSIEFSSEIHAKFPSVIIEVMLSGFPELFNPSTKFAWISRRNSHCDSLENFFWGSFIVYYIFSSKVPPGIIEEVLVWVPPGVWLIMFSRISPEILLGKLYLGRVLYKFFVQEFLWDFFLSRNSSWSLCSVVTAFGNFAKPSARVLRC